MEYQSTTHPILLGNKRRKLNLTESTAGRSAFRRPTPAEVTTNRSLDRMQTLAHLPLSSLAARIEKKLDVGLRAQNPNGGPIGSNGQTLEYHICFAHADYRLFVCQQYEPF